MNLVHTIEVLASHHYLYAYLSIYGISIFLGDISAFIAFWVAIQGFLGPWGVLLVILVVALAYASGDMLWYALGRGLRDTRFGLFLKNHLPRHALIEQHMEKNGLRWVFLSKFIVSSSFPILFFAGWFRLNFRKVIRRGMFAILAWMPVLTAFSYILFASLSPLRAITIFKHVELLLSIGLLLFIIITSVITWTIELLFGKD